MTALRAQLSAYLILTNATLLAVAKYPPKNAGELASTKGIGPKKVKKYGSEILKIVGK